MKKAKVIAEIGCNHKGEFDLALELIQKAKSCGADVAKFQKRNPDKCVPEEQKNVMRSTPWGEMSYINYKYKVEFGKPEYDIINDESNSRNIAWTASVWDYDSLDFLVNNYKNIHWILGGLAKANDKIITTNFKNSILKAYISANQTESYLKLRQMDQDLQLMEMWNI